MPPGLNRSKRVRVPRRRSSSSAPERIFCWSRRIALRDFPAGGKVERKELQMFLEHQRLRLTTIEHTVLQGGEVVAKLPHDPQVDIQRQQLLAIAGFGKDLAKRVDEQAVAAQSTPPLVPAPLQAKTNAWSSTPGRFSRSQGSSRAAGQAAAVKKISAPRSIIRR